MRLAGSSDDAIAGARASAFWPGLQALAPTLAYDAACLGDGAPPARFATLDHPVLVLTGGHAADFFVAAADAVAALLPRAERLVLAGQGHVAASGVLGPALARFFAG
jgi:pimeloyl-ACP methyl ester carboxylesterase